MSDENLTVTEVVNSVTVSPVNNTVTVSEVGTQGPAGTNGTNGTNGATGATGATGSSGVIAVTAPITNSGTSTAATIGIDTTDFALKNAANTFTGGVQQITTSNASTVGLILKGTVSQTANLQEWQDSNSAVKATIGSGGNGVFNGLRSGSGSTTGAINAYATSAQIGILVQGAASQTANLQQWRNSAATVLTSITSSGTINFASGNTSATATAGAVTPPILVAGYITMQVAGTTVKVPYYAS